ncbi:hypothetical protein SAMN04488029_0372 [Reichenbachiella faecimaris]|uniref:Uncharacterized protein n=1 Tax=Reichenbachiella faecimaris TaxID=692418 RepID=A0A1W2G687_REIFA|nr:hypothetical protein [Reichenbachiella faecimaris]SMD32034.1 hypothetical protein SAMN04488029_0372 [Reichenbachiella faecimaris]
MKIKYLLIATTFLIQGTSLWGQEIDQEKMDRDLKIAEDVVSSLVKGESNDGRFYAASPKASYIPGFGVMIDLNSSGKFYSNNFDPSFDFRFSFDEEDFRIDINDMVELEMQAEMLARQAEEIEHQAEIIERENERMLRDQQRALEEKERALERQMEQLERQREREEDRMKHERERIKRSEVNRIVIDTDDEYTYRYSYSNSDENDEDDKGHRYVTRGYQKDFEDLKPLYRKVMTTFLTDYADLIGQLADNEQVMLITKGGPQGFGAVYLTSTDQAGKFSASTTRKNIADFKAGRVSRTAFENGINFAESKGEERVAADLELFSSILQRLYKTDLATTYYTSSPISYERLKSFGVIYRMKMYSSVSMGRDSYRMPTQRKSNLSREERNKEVMALYPQFIREFKKNIIDYGKTIKSLAEDESMLFQIRLTECNSCDIPNEINVLVKNQTLLDLDAGKISESQAIAQIQIKEAS